MMNQDLCTIHVYIEENHYHKTFAACTCCGDICNVAFTLEVNISFFTLSMHFFQLHICIFLQNKKQIQLLLPISPELVEKLKI